jgi:CHAT domain-containing protein
MAGFRTAMPVLIQASTGPYVGESVARATRLRVMVEAYLHELARGIAAGPAGVQATGQQTLAAVDAMLRAAEAARSRTLVDAIASAAIRSGLKDRDLADLVRRDQDAARRIVALYDSLAGWFQLPADARKPADEAALRRDIAAAEAERATLNSAIAARSPAIAGLARPMPVGVAELRAALKPGEAAVLALVGAVRSFVFAVPQQGAPMAIEAPLGREAIAQSVARLRSAMTDGGRGIEAVPPVDLRAAYAEIYQPLLKPLEPALAGAQSLLVVADGALAQIPWAMLPTEPAQPAATAGSPRFAEYRQAAWLIRRQAVTHLPSATALVALRRITPAAQAPRPFVGIGDPIFAAAPARQSGQQRSAVRATFDRNVALRALESLPPLPDTRIELEQIAKELGANSQSELYLGRRASEGEVRRAALDRYRVVAFATHGLAAGDVDGLLQPALALSSPKVTAEDGDGLLTMSEVMDLRLAADWVVLSACNTAGEVAPGAEVLSGLASAFFYSGARSLLVTHWAVETTAARLLTTGLFADKAPNRAEALRRSMLAMIDGRAGDGASGRAKFSYAHPMFWAPFALVGDPG